MVPAAALAATPAGTPSATGSGAPTLATAQSASGAATAAFPRSTRNFVVPFPKVDTSGLPPELAGEVKKGEYLVRISDCMACHTDHSRSEINGKPFAGGLPLKTAFGDIYSRNITPDKETGIGDWTFEQFDKAVRYGVSPHGYLFAAMPYNNYNRMSKAQVRDIWEYLKRVPAVHRKNKPVGLLPPFSWRWLQFGWRFLFFKPVEDVHHYDPHHPFDPNRSEQWNRGRFIVKGPAHCGTCHTPHSLLGSAQHSHALAGSAFSGMWAPNIGSAASGAYSVATISRVFKDARGLAGGDLRGPMLDAVSNSLKYLTPADMKAVAVYIRSVTGTPAGGPQPVSPAAVDLALGQKTYQTTCAACHAAGIGGAPKVGNAEDWKSLSKEPILILFQNVWHGVSIMPAKGGCNTCSRRDISSAIAYMLTQSQPGANATAAAEQASSGTANAGIPKNTVSLAVGKQIYQAHCAACHAGGLYGAPRYGDASQWTTRLKLGLDQLHQNAFDGIGAMPPKGGCASCSEDQILSAVNYIVAGSGGKAMVEKSQAAGG